MSVPGMRVRLENLADLELTASADGKLVEVSLPDGAPPFRIEHDDGFQLELATVVSKIRGEWRVVR